MSLPRKADHAFLPEAMVESNPALSLVLDDFKKRLTPKPAVFESAYECGSFTCHYRYHFDPQEPEREIVEEITCYADKDGQQVSFEDLEAKGFTVPDALRLQGWVDDTAWEARNQGPINIGPWGKPILDQIEPEACPTCEGQCTVSVPGTTDGSEMDCPNCGGMGRKR